MRFNPLCNGAGFATPRPRLRLLPSIPTGFNPLCNGAGFATSGGWWLVPAVYWQSVSIPCVTGRALRLKPDLLQHEHLFDGFNPLCNGAGFATPRPPSLRPPPR